MHVTIYSDGSSRAETRGLEDTVRFCITDPSGKLHMKELSQGFDYCPTIEWSFLGVIAALEVLKRPCEIDVISDSNTW